MAIDCLTPVPMDPIEKIRLGRKYHVENWLMNGFHELVVRKAVITVEEAEAIDWQTAIKLYIVRDAWKDNKKKDAHLQEKLYELFAPDVSAIRLAQGQFSSIEEKELVRSPQDWESQEGMDSTERDDEDTVQATQRQSDLRRLRNLAMAEEQRLAAESEEQRSPAHPEVIPIEEATDVEDKVRTRTRYPWQGLIPLARRRFTVREKTREKPASVAESQSTRN